MAAKGITLAPMRMGDVVSTPKPVSKYMPPSRRPGSDGKPPPIVEKIDMTEQNFPRIGSVPVKATAWGKHVVTKPEATKPEATKPDVVIKPEAEVVQPKEVSEKKETLSDKIKEKLRLDAIADELGTKKEELDHSKMTDAQLEKAGWVRLRLGSAKDICMNGFTNQGNPYLPGFIEEADTGMSFEEYVHYKKSYNQSEVTLSPKKNTTPEVQYEDYSEDEE